MTTNRYLKLGCMSIIAVIFGIAISLPFMNRVQANDHEKHDHKKLELNIKGMDCEHCAKAINAIISKCSGVTGCAVSFEEGKAIIEVEADKAEEETEEIIEELKGAGYEIPDWHIEDLY